MNPRVIAIAVMSLAIVMMSVIGVFLYGLFDNRVDNHEIMTILGPAFQTVVGCFVGLVGGQAMGRDR